MKQFEKLERQSGSIPLILKLDQSGLPIKWIGWQTAVTLMFNEKIKWSLGSTVKLYGGTCAATNERSYIEMPTILACEEQFHRHSMFSPIMLTQRSLFRRDHHTCMYCGNTFSHQKLSKDHIIPTSRGGKDVWTNCVAACVPCNHRKADRTPEEAGMKLLAVPYTPSRAESLILQNRKILSDQAEFLSGFLPSDSRAWKYVKQ